MRKFCKILMAMLTIAALSTAAQASSKSYLLGLSFFQDGDAESALKIWTPLSKQGDPDAQFIIGALYESGQYGYEQSYKKAAELFSSAAEKGHARSQFNLAMFYYDGRGVEKSIDKMVFWLKKAEASGMPEAAAALKEIQKIIADK
ncbi:MAG: sel1 repeat family protein [Alphaproteobacteria bacterium]|nr:sel1 repeat family protein [Alphaproteobacteria bacterium]